MAPPKTTTKKSHAIPLRIDLDVKDALERRAADDERTQAWLINKILRGFFGLDDPDKAIKPKAGKAKG